MFFRCLVINRKYLVWAETRQQYNCLWKFHLSNWKVKGFLCSCAYWETVWHIYNLKRVRFNILYILCIASKKTIVFTWRWPARAETFSDVSEIVKINKNFVAIHGVASCCFRYQDFVMVAVYIYILEGKWSVSRGSRKRICKKECGNEEWIHPVGDKTLWVSWARVNTIFGIHGRWKGALITSTAITFWNRTLLRAVNKKLIPRNFYNLSNRRWGMSLPCLEPTACIILHLLKYLVFNKLS
jgi:hypothetical protein